MVRTLAAVLVLALVACDSLVQCVSNSDCLVEQFCDPLGDCQDTAGNSGGPSTASSGTNAGNSSGNSAGSSGSTIGGGTTGGTSATAGGTSGSGGCPTEASATTSVLATVDSLSDGQIWDLTNAASPQEIIGPADLLSDIPTALAVSPDYAGEILVLLDTEGLVAFDSSANNYGYLGQIEVPTASSGDFPGGSGLAYLPQTSGEPLIVVCGDSVTAFYYGGASSFSNGKAYPAALWAADEDSLNGCLPGPCNTLYAESDTELDQYDALTGNPIGSGVFATSQGNVNGAAVAPNGDVLVVGDDGTADGFVALFNPAGACLGARSGGNCTLAGCNPCVTGDTTLASTPLYQASALPSGEFLATATTENPTAMYEVYEIDPGNDLAVSVYVNESAQSVDFYGLFVSPEPL